MPFKLAGKLSLNSDTFKKGLDKSGQAVKKMGARMGSTFSRIGRRAKVAAHKIKKGFSNAAGKLKSAFSGVAGKLAAVAGTAAILDQVKQAIDWSAKVRDLGNAWGISTEEVQRFQYAARQSGIEIEDVMDNMKDLAKSAGEVTSATGYEGKAAMFRTLGIEIDQLRGKNPAEVFELVAAAVQKMGNVTTPEALIALEGLGGGAGIKTLNMMKSGFGDLGAKFNELGLAVEDVTVQKLAAMSDKLAEVEDRWAAVRAEALSTLMDTGSGVGDWLAGAHEMGVQAFEDLLLYGPFRKGKDREGDLDDVAANTIVDRRQQREKEAEVRKKQRAADEVARVARRKAEAEQRAVAAKAKKQAEAKSAILRAGGESRLAEAERRQSGWTGFGATGVEKIGGGLGMKTTQLNIAQQHLALAKKSAERAIAVANNVQEIKNQVAE